MLERIRERAEQAIQEQVFPGCVIGIARQGEQVILPFGHYTYEQEQPVEADTVYDLASVTKSIPVASLIAHFSAEGAVRLSDPIAEYIPELKADQGATLEDLLLYRVSGPRLSLLSDKSADAIQAHILSTGLERGEEKYTNLPAFLLGLILERISNTSLDRLAEQVYFHELGMSATTFFPRSPTVPTEIVGEVIVGVPHDESARVFSRAGRAVGHAGLFSSAPDILTFLDMLQAEHSIEAGFAEQGLGWQKAQAWFMGTHAGTTTFGKTGFTGTSVLSDRARGISLVILSNRTYPTRPPDAASLTSAINVLRRDIADIVLA